MKKNLSLIALSLLSFALSGQNTDSSKTRKMTIGIVFSPDYNYRILATDDNPANQLLLGYRNARETPKFGFTTGLSFMYRLTDKVGLETGLLFSDKGEKTKYTEYTDIDGTIIKRARFRYSYNYLDIPVKMNFFLLAKKLNLFLSAGVSANIFLYHQVTNFIEDPNGKSSKESSISKDEFSRLNLAVLGGIGIEQELKRRLKIRIEPVFRRSVTSITDAPIKDTCMQQVLMQEYTLHFKNRLR